MQTRYLRRAIEAGVRAALRAVPAVAVLGPRQCGKSTLAREIIRGRREALYLDLERPSDRQRLAEPELFLKLHENRLVCLDEIQRMPEIFPVLRSLIDARRHAGRFLILGSASRDLIRQSSETLAGRISYLELTPFRAVEVAPAVAGPARLWLRGGFPGSLLARTQAASVRWRQDFVRGFLERDVPQLGVRIPAATLERFWRMCAHHHGQIMNQSQLGAALGVSHVTVRSYLELLSATFMLRLLPPLLPNLRKRLVKSPRVYLRDAGILHSLLDIESEHDLLGHPQRGASGEGWVIENAIAQFSGWRPVLLPRGERRRAGPGPGERPQAHCRRMQGVCRARRRGGVLDRARGPPHWRGLGHRPGPRRLSPRPRRARCPAAAVLARSRTPPPGVKRIGSPARQRPRDCSRPNRSSASCARQSARRPPSA